MVIGLIYIVPNLISSLLERESRFLAFIVDITDWVLNTIVSLGLIKISLNFYDNLKSKITDIFSQYRLFFRILFASILHILIVGFGPILLIILGIFLRLFFRHPLASYLSPLILLLVPILLIFPGIYLAIRLQFYSYFIVDRNSRIIESLKRSWLITKGNVWNLFLFGLLLGLINLLGVLVLLIGLFAAIPTTMLARTFVYRKLLSQSEISGETKGE